MTDWSDIVFYDETSPSCLRWACDRGNGIGVGDAVGTFDKQGRWSFVVTAFGTKKRRYCHRVIWELLTGESLPEDLEIDHKDGLQWNNKFLNLRKVTASLNRRNTTMSTRNKTGVTGVSRNEIVCPSGVYVYWVASWKTLDGKRRSKNFSVFTLGEKVARAKAIAHRVREIAQMNNLGAGYTTRHGLRSENK